MSIPKMIKHNLYNKNKHIFNNSLTYSSLQNDLNIHFILKSTDQPY